MNCAAHTPSDPEFLRPSPEKQWKTLITPHFRINHEASHQEYAQQMGAMAEQVHQKLTAWLGWRPEEQTEIVILDNVDFSNGAATVLPYNQFYIYMATPAEGEIMDQNPWMEYVFTHEYIHILHLDMAYGSAKTIRDTFGRPIELMTVATFPQIFAPSWVIEGLAVYGESNNPSGYGRLSNAWYETQMQLEVQRGLRSLTEVSFEGYSGSRWPAGINYLYGAYFFKFINEYYGRNTAINYIRIYSGNLIPWRMDQRSMLIFGKPADAVWDEFQHYLQKNFSTPTNRLAAKNNVDSLYNEPYINRFLTATGHGELYFYHDDGASHPQIRRIRADGSNEYLFNAENVSGLDWQDSAGLLLNKAAVCNNTELHLDLYRWKPGMPSPIRLTHCGRYARAVWRPNGQQIAAVQLSRGLSQLVLIDAEGKHLETLSQLPLGDTLGHLAWSPNGEQLVASVKRQATGWNLELFNVKERNWQQLTLNSELKTRPHFAKNGLDIYFISDHNHRWELSLLNMADQSITPLSGPSTGIYEAIEMPDASFRVTEYTAFGQAIQTLKPTRENGTPYPAMAAVIPSIDSIVTSANYRTTPYSDVSDYSALDTLKPRSWVPFWVSTADQNSFAGVTLYAADVLGFHQWSAIPYYYLDQHTLGGQASYQFHHALTLSAERQSLIVGSNSDLLQYQSDELRYQAMLHHSFNSTERSLYLAGGTSSERIKASLTHFNGIDLTYQDNLAGVMVRYDDTEFYQRSISLVDGRRIQLTSETYDAFHNSHHSGKTHQLDWKEYIGLGANHVLYLRMLLAAGNSGIRPYSLGGEIETPLVPSGSTDLGRRRFMLRGYPASLPSLSGTKMGLLTAEWRIPLGLVYDGFFVPPVGLGKHSLSLFIDHGDAWSNGEKFNPKSGAGLAWNGELLIGYDMLHLGTTLGFAHGFDQGGEDRAYLLMGLPF